MSKLFEDLKEGLEEVVAYEKGKKKLRTRKIKVPKPPSQYTAKDIKKIRSKAHYSQSVFADVLNVSIKTVQAWESGYRIPSHIAMRLLEIVDKGYYRPQISSY
ncbi:MAG: Antitoxin HigA-2 [Candidatus Anoxychlamydiales bacterium]|nr:Antitoxin HigA-2 [Candidatus Anoxychlamydiales bacterium]